MKRWAVRGVVGALMAAIGVALFVVVDGPSHFVVVLAASGLVVAGAGRLLGVRDHGPWRARWLDVVLGGGLLLAGGVALVWHGASLRLLAWVLAGVLAASGLTAVVEAVRRPRSDAAREAFDGHPGSERIAGILGGVATVLLAALVVLWPKLSLAVFALVVGVWLTFSGLGMIFGAWRVRGALRARGARRARGGRREPGSRDGGATAARAPRSAVRRQLSLVGAGGSLVIALALAVGTVALHRIDLREEPDAFYTPPLAVPSEPGRLIRSAPLPAERVPEGLRAWRILYTSTDGEGRPTVVSGTVLAPGVDTPGAEDPGVEPPGPGAPGATGRAATTEGDDSGDGRATPSSAGMPVVSVAHGTTGVVPRCAPSLAADPFADGAGAALEQIVGEGWVGVTSDYVGLGTRGPHGYLVGPDAAHDVLDATRAARELTELSLSHETVVWGHSQGGHGALWTGIAAPTYAPELDVLGVAAFAPAADLFAIAQGVRDTTGGKLVSAYIAASWSQFYDFELDDLVTPGYGGIVHRIEGHCFNGANVLGALAVASQLTDEVFRPEVWESDLVDLLVANSPTGDIGVPVLVAQGTADQLVGVEQQRELVARRCAEGQVIDYREYEGLDHVPLVEADSPLTTELLEWTRDRLAGVPAVESC